MEHLMTPAVVIPSNCDKADAFCSLIGSSWLLYMLRSKVKFVDIMSLQSVFIIEGLDNQNYNLLTFLTLNIITLSVTNGKTN